MHKFYLDYAGLNEKELESAFKRSCGYGDIEKAKYLLDNNLWFSDEIINDGLKVAFLKNNESIISFLLDNYNIREEFVDNLISIDKGNKSVSFLLSIMYDKKLPFQDVKRQKIKI